MPHREKDTRSGPGFSRRDFLKGSGAAVAASAVATATQEGLAQQAREDNNVVRAEPTDVTLNVNGKEHTLKLEPRVTLQDALRNDLNLTGLKDVCDTSNCGSCTVIVDGKAVYSCTRLAHEMQGKEIRTVESLRRNGQVDEVVAGFVKHDAQQCGFCTPGFVMAVRAFLDQKPDASLEDIRKGLGGNLCRCGTYVGITQCALEIAKGGE